jgi:hypothetical protein
MAIEGKEVHTKSIGNIFFKRLQHKTSQIWRKRCLFRYKRPLELQTDTTRIETLHSIL